MIACAKEGTKCSCAILLAHKLESHSTPLLIPLTAQTIVRVGCGDVQETISNSKGFFLNIALMGGMPFDTRLCGEICTPCFYEVSEREQ